MKRLHLAGSLALASALLTTGCLWGPDFANSAPQIPRAPAIGAELKAPTPNSAPVATSNPISATPSPNMVSATPASATPASAIGADPSARTDYSRDANWLCKPGIANNACDVNLDATIVKADGSTTTEKFTPNPDAPIDCFYVYPTVSLDPFTQSDLVPGPEELNVVKAQFARLGSQCRLYAPMYRQFSLGALRARMSGAGAVPTRGTPADANNDIDDAWAYYLAHNNHGRGVVILGHSQGSGQIMRLIAAKVDGTPDQAKLVSAIVMGSSVQVPVGKDVGGTFKNIPTCKSASQTGCVISFSTFRSNIPPAEKAMFGRGGDGTEAVCTNPAALGGGVAKNPKAYWSTADKVWVKDKTITTPFVMTPGLTTTECVHEAGHVYLKATFNADPNDPRIDDPGNDVMAQGKPDPNWGLHLVDANIAMGDLVDVVGKQAKAWKAAHP